jgi:hypothetical protein
MIKKKKPQSWSKIYSLLLARRVAGYRKLYEAGQHWFVLLALDDCLNAWFEVDNPKSRLNRRYLPEPWMLKGLWDGMTAVREGADLNEAFAFVRPKGTHVKGIRVKRRQAQAILFRIYDLHCNEGMSLDDSGAFLVAGQDFGCSARQVRRIHDAASPKIKAMLLKSGIRQIRPEDIAGLDD